MAAKDISTEVLQNPELYGLRRSHRAAAHQQNYFNESDDEDDEDNIKQSRRKRMTTIEDDEDELVNCANDVAQTVSSAKTAINLIFLIM